jgi:hypothetical protein
MLEELLSEAVAVIPLVHNRMCQRQLRRQLRKHDLKDWTLMTLPRREDYRNTGAFITTAGMDFGGQAPPRAAQSLCGLPAVFFNAPAAC